MNKEIFQQIFVMLREEIARPDSVEWCTWKYMRQHVDQMIAKGMTDYLHAEMQLQPE